MCQPKGPSVTPKTSIAVEPWDGTPVVFWPVMGSDDWRIDETLDPQWDIPSEFVHGTIADYSVVPMACTC
jgi:hypothetical protein